MPTKNTKDHADLILRDFLAVERTHLANQRTFLSMLRTGLYFLVLGLSILSLADFKELKPYSLVFFSVAGVIITLGVVGYFRTKKKIVELYTTKRQ